MDTSLNALSGVLFLIIYLIVILVLLIVIASRLGSISKNLGISTKTFLMDGITAEILGDKKKAIENYMRVLIENKLNYYCMEGLSIFETHQKIVSKIESLGGEIPAQYKDKAIIKRGNFFKS